MNAFGCLTEAESPSFYSLVIKSVTSDFCLGKFMEAFLFLGGKIEKCVLMLMDFPQEEKQSSISLTAKFTASCTKDGG